MEGVGRAADKVLGGHFLQLLPMAVVDLGVGSNARGCRECPAGSAHALMGVVLMVMVVPQRDTSINHALTWSLTGVTTPLSLQSTDCGSPSALTSSLRGKVGPAGVDTSPLVYRDTNSSLVYGAIIRILLCKVGKLGHAHGPAVSFRIVLLNLSEVVPEH